MATFAGTGGVLFLAAVATAPLLALHEQVSQVLQAHRIDQWPRYLPGSWVPHCTLAMGHSPADLAAAMNLLSGFEPFDAQVTGAGATETATGIVTALGRPG